MQLSGHLFCIATEVDNEAAGPLISGSTMEPTVQTGAVGRRDPNLFRTRQQRNRLAITFRERHAQKDQSFLEQIEHCAQPNVCGETRAKQPQHWSLQHCTSAAGHPEVTLNWI